MNLKRNLSRLTKRKIGNTNNILTNSTKSCEIPKNYDDYFFSSSRKLDYSNTFFKNDSEFNYSEALSEKDEIFEESPDFSMKAPPKISKFFDLTMNLKINLQESKNLDQN